MFKKVILSVFCLCIVLSSPEASAIDKKRLRENPELEPQGSCSKKPCKAVKAENSIPIAAAGNKRSRDGDTILAVDQNPHSRKIPKRPDSLPGPAQPVIPDDLLQYPKFEPLSSEGFNALVMIANSGDAASQRQIMLRLYWGMTPDNWKNNISLDSWQSIEHVEKDALTLYFTLTFLGSGNIPITYMPAIKKAKDRALNGSQVDQNLLGNIYQKGYGVARDYAEAFKWYKKSAEQGYAQEQCNLGLCYRIGLGVEQDDAEAFKWSTKAAEQGHAQAQFSLGLCYQQGQGVMQNLTEAVKWLTKAAEQGHAQAQCNLALAYYKGQGVTQDYTEAAKWYRKAAEQGHAQAQFSLGLCYQNGLGVMRDYAEAFKWYKAAAEQGHAQAQCNLGYCYEQGLGVTQNHEEAFQWYQKAAEQGHAQAQCNLAGMHTVDLGVTRNFVEAVKWYTKAAEQGHVQAQGQLAFLYRNGLGVTRNFAEAAKWYTKAAEQGFALAQNNLAAMYLRGLGIAQDYAEAGKWFLKAANQKYKPAYAPLAVLYERGLYGRLQDGTPNLERAAYYYGLNSTLPLQNMNNPYAFYIYLYGIQNQEIVQNPLVTQAIGDKNYTINPDFFKHRSVTIKMLQDTFGGEGFNQENSMLKTQCTQLEAGSPNNKAICDFLKRHNLSDRHPSYETTAVEKALFAYMLQLVTNVEAEDQKDFFDLLVMNLNRCNSGRENSLIAYAETIVHEDIKQTLQSLEYDLNSDLSESEVKFTKTLLSAIKSLVKSSLYQPEFYQAFNVSTNANTDIMHDLSYLDRVLSGHMFFQDLKSIDQHPHVVHAGLRNKDKQELLDCLYRYFKPSLFVDYFHEQFNGFIHDGKKMKFAMESAEFTDYIGTDQLDVDEECMYSVSKSAIADMLARVGILEDAAE